MRHAEQETCSTPRNKPYKEAISSDIQTLGPYACHLKMLHSHTCTILDIYELLN